MRHITHRLQATTNSRKRFKGAFVSLKAGTTAPHARCTTCTTWKVLVIVSLQEGKRKGALNETKKKQLRAFLASAVVNLHQRIILPRCPLELCFVFRPGGLPGASGPGRAGTAGTCGGSAAQKEPGWCSPFCINWIRV